MEAQLLGIALAPVLFILGVIWLKDKYERESLKTVLKAFLFGVLSVIIALFIYGMWDGIVDNSFWYRNSGTLAMFAWGVVGFSEEFAKYILVWWFFYRKPFFNEPYDGIVYAVAVSLGFAGLENIMYVFQQPTASLSMQVGIMRMFTAVPAHAMFGVLMGYYMGKAKFQKNSLSWDSMLLALLVPIGFHGAYDWFLFTNNELGLGTVAIIVLIWGWRFALKAIKEHQENSPFKPGSSKPSPPVRKEKKQPDELSDTSDDDDDDWIHIDPHYIDGPSNGGGSGEGTGV